VDPARQETSSSFPSRRRRRLPKMSTPYPNLNLLFPSVELPSGYKNRAPDPSAPSSFDAKRSKHLEEASLGSPTRPAATSSTMATSGQLCPRNRPWWDRIALLYIPVSFFREIMLWIELLPSPTMAPSRNWSPAYFFGRNAVGWLPDPIWSVQIKSNDSDLVIPVRLVFLLKSP
jgi:hypothetical protein